MPCRTYPSGVIDAQRDVLEPLLPLPKPVDFLAPRISTMSSTSCCRCRALAVLCQRSQRSAPWPPSGRVSIGGATMARGIGGMTTCENRCATRLDAILSPVPPFWTGPAGQVPRLSKDVERLVRSHSFIIRLALICLMYKRLALAR